jgi:prevent-host-death family protein
MHTWQLQEAKAQLSEVVRLCAIEGPQVLTVRGKEEAIILSKKDFDALLGKKEKFYDLLQKSPLRGVNLDIKRNPSKGRKIRL